MLALKKGFDALLETALARSPWKRRKRDSDANVATADESETKHSEGDMEMSIDSPEQESSAAPESDGPSHATKDAEVAVDSLLEAAASENSESRDDATLQALESTESVVEGTRDLIPTCTHYKSYGKNKQALTERTLFLCCGQQARCMQPQFCPTPDEHDKPKEFVLTTADTQRDLASWLDMRVRENRIVRTTDHLKDPRFSDENLRTAMLATVPQMRDLHVEIHALADYARREPYFIIVNRVLDEADTKLLQMASSDVRELSRHQLVDGMLGIAAELDYLVTYKEDLVAAILKARYALAKQGDWAERDALRRMGHGEAVERMSD